MTLASLLDHDTDRLLVGGLCGCMATLAVEVRLVRLARADQPHGQGHPSCVVFPSRCGGSPLHARCSAPWCRGRSAPPLLIPLLLGLALAFLGLLLLLPQPFLRLLLRLTLSLVGLLLRGRRTA